MLLDTSVLVELLRNPPTHPTTKAILEAIGDQRVYASPIHLGEIADASRRAGLEPHAQVEAVRRMVDLVPLDAGIAVMASDLKAQARRRKKGRDFSLIDGVGLASARTRGMPLLTFDHEFDGFADVTVLER